MARGMDEADARSRMAAQMPLDSKAAHADVLLDNERHDRRSSRRQVDRLWADLRGGPYHRGREPT